MSNKELSLESILSNGLGIDNTLTINDNTSKQSYESFPNASIIDNTYINNDLSYIKTLESLYINHSKDKINLYKRLNNIYGKGKSKSLESYLYNKSKDINNKCKSYIENSNESYNRLLEMSREGISPFTQLSILISVLKIVYKLGKFGIKVIGKQIEPNLVKRRLKSNPQLESIVESFYKELNNFSEGVSTISKLGSENDINDNITKTFNLTDNDQYEVEFNVGSIFNTDKKKVYNNSLVVIKDLVNSNILNGKESSLKEINLEKFVSLWFTFNKKNIDATKDIIKKLSSSKTVEIINTELKKVNKKLYVKYNSVDSKNAKDGFSFIKFDLCYKFDKDYSSLAKELEKTTKL